MCGIAGIMGREGAPPDSAVLDALAAALRHRGPDGEGRYRAGDVGMAQTRLAIIDLETGDQPLHGPEGTGLIANAEIYNYRELRGGFGEDRFATRSDCEPPLHLYARDGLHFTDGLRGMYAIALHDPSAGRLLLARDPFGIKPLYYAETARGLAFASEPQALVAAGLVAPRVAPRARDELLQLQFSTGAQTVFEGIRRVLPGETLELKGGRVEGRRRIAALPAGRPAEWHETDALKRLETALVNSVDVHQRSDVPYGLFLSGGIDSSALLALMARLNEQPVRAFTAGFPGTSAHDERAHARMLAAKVGAEHVEVTFDEDDFWALLPEIAACLDDPTADYAVLPTYKLGARAGEELKVILCGEGGDELFAGYGRYRSAARPRLLGGRPMRRHGILDGMGVLRREAEGWRDGIAAAERAAAGEGRSRLQVAQAIDCADWLPHDLLTKLDRCLMAHGVEGRVPLLDPVVAEVAFRLPDRLKVRGNRGKYLLRRWLAEALPEAEPFSRKRGFTVPVGEWIARRGAALGPLVAAQPGIAEVCKPNAVAALFARNDKRAGFAAWTLLFYALWHRRHILGAAPAGDVFDTLAAEA
jgi:asparagine synthase (glutamine-hydrolysing)